MTALCLRALKCLRLQVSLSLGCPAVFVFGGETREHDALALLLRSGDVLVMVNRSFDDWHSLILSRIVPRAGGQCAQVLPRCASRSASASRFVDILDIAAVTIAIVITANIVIAGCVCRESRERRVARAASHTTAGREFTH
jgi:hypothetical protein